MRPPSPTWEGLDDVYAEWDDLYRGRPPEGDYIPLLVQLVAIVNDPPS